MNLAVGGCTKRLCRWLDLSLSNRTLPNNWQPLTTKPARWLYTGMWNACRNCMTDKFYLHWIGASFALGSSLLASFGASPCSPSCFASCPSCPSCPSCTCPVWAAWVSSACDVLGLVIYIVWFGPFELWSEPTWARPEPAWAHSLVEIEAAFGTLHYLQQSTTKTREEQ